jgi:transposase
MALILRRNVQRKIVYLEICLRHCVKVFGIRLGATSRRRFAEALQEAIGDDRLLQAMVHGVLRGRAALLDEFALIERALIHMAEADEVCRRLMTVPGVGPISALSFKAAVDDPARFRKSRSVGVYFGLTPRRRQSGEHEGWSCPRAWCRSVAEFQILRAGCDALLFKRPGHWPDRR